MVTERIDIDEERLTDFCMRWRINELALFGSALREDFGPESDLDILVTFESGSEWGLLDHVNMEQQLSKMRKSGSRLTVEVTIIDCKREQSYVMLKIYN
jgi:predicted nucleotidyltransferase